MLYDAYEVQRSLLAGASKLAGLGAGWLNNPANPWGYSSMGPLWPLLASKSSPMPLRRTESPNSESTASRSAARDVRVDEQILLRKPFGQLKHFARDGIEKGPRLLIVAPMSGHYATLLRGTVAAAAAEASTSTSPTGATRSWCRCRKEASTSTTISIISIEFLEHIGKKTGERPHLLAVCQPAVPAFAATALMNADKNPWRPKTPDHDGRPDRHA